MSPLSFLGVLLVTLADDTPTNPNMPTPSSLLKRSPAMAISSVADTQSHPATANPPLGDFFAILSALFYALYVTLLKYRIRDESRINMQLFFGFVGLFNVLALWPIGVILHITGIEPFELPSSTTVWVVIGINVRSFYGVNTKSLT